MRNVRVSLLLHLGACPHRATAAAQQAQTNWQQQQPKTHRLSDNHTLHTTTTADNASVRRNETSLWHVLSASVYVCVMTPQTTENEMSNAKAKSKKQTDRRCSRRHRKFEKCVRRFDDLKELFVQTDHGAKAMIVVSTTITITITT